MNEPPKEQKLDTSGRLVESTIQNLLTTTSAELTRAYERLRWLGFSAVVGALMIVASFIFTLIPGIALPLKSQILFVLTGFGMLLLSAALYALQNIHAFRLEDRNRDITIRSLELKYDVDKAIALKPVENPQGQYAPPTG
jgi:hypothetical protein